MFAVVIQFQTEVQHADARRVVMRISHVFFLLIFFNEVLFGSAIGVTLLVRSRLRMRRSSRSIDDILHGIVFASRVR